MKYLQLFLAVLFLGSASAQFPRPGLLHATVGQAFSLALGEMKGAAACKTTKLPPSQSQFFDFDRATSMVKGTAQRAGFAALKVTCTWASPVRAQTTLVQIKVDPAKSATAAPAPVKPEK